MPTYHVALPDGSEYDVNGPEGMSDSAVWGALQQHLAEAPQPQSGFLPALQSGYAGLKGDIATLAGRTGLMDPAAADKYIAEQNATQKAKFAPTEKGWTEAPGTKIGELLGQSLPYMVAPVVVGGAAALGGAPAMVGAGLAGLASATQFTGSNL